VGAVYGMGTNSPVFSLEKVAFQSNLLVQVPSPVVFTERQDYINTIILLLGLRKKRRVYHLWKKGQATQEEHRGLVRSS